MRHILSIVLVLLFANLCFGQELVVSEGSYTFKVVKNGEEWESVCIIPNKGYDSIHMETQRDIARASFKDWVRDELMKAEKKTEVWGLFLKSCKKTDTQWIVIWDISSMYAGMESVTEKLKTLSTFTPTPPQEKPQKEKEPEKKPQKEEKPEKKPEAKEQSPKKAQEKKPEKLNPRWLAWLVVEPILKEKIEKWGYFMGLYTIAFILTLMVLCFLIKKRFFLKLLVSLGISIPAVFFLQKWQQFSHFQGLKNCLLFLMASLPVYFFLLYYYKKDRYKPECKFTIAFFFILSGLVTIPLAYVFQMTIIHNTSFTGIVKVIFSAYVTAACTEELLKFFMLLFIFTRPYFDEKIDGIVYAVTVSLGFAFVENLIYVFCYYPGFQTAFARALTAVPAHALAGATMGYFFGHAKFAKTWERKFMWMFIGFVMALLFHGTYDFLLFSKNAHLGTFIFPILFFTGWMVNMGIQKILSKRKSQVVT